MNGENRCEDRRELIAALVMGALDSARAERLQKHIAGCEECRGLYRALCGEETEIRSTFEAISTAFKGTEGGILEKAKSGGFENWESAQDEERTRRKTRIIVSIAAAAIVVIAVVIGARLLIKGEDVGYVKDPSGNSRKDVPVLSQQEKLARELKAVDQMFAAKDSAGLISILDTGLWESKIAAAKYLGQIGGADALKPLSILLGSWDGDPGENPFSAAIEQIESRLRAPEPNESESKGNGTQNTTPAGQASFKFEARGVLSGVVTDAQSGEPVAGAEVEVSMGRIYDAQTDANGFYCIEKIRDEGNHRISVTSQEYVGVTDYDKMPIVNLRNGSREVRHFKLSRACMIEVRVVDQDGKPLEGADLIATSLADERRREIGESRYMRRTDANGIMVLGGFTPSETESYQITARHYTKGKSVEKNGRKYEERYWDYAPSRAVVKLSDPNVLETCTIVMKKGIEVAGYAEYSDGVPAEGLEICPYPDWWHTNTSPEDYAIDANGFFIMPQIAPGMYNIHVSFPRDSLGYSSSYSVLQTRLPLPEGELLVVKVPKKSPQSLVSISGKITFATEKRPRSYEVSAYSPQKDHQYIHVGGDQDTFELNSLEPGVYTLRFSGANLEEKVIKNVKAPSSDLEVELEYMERPKVRGVVLVTDTNEPAKQFRARIRKLKTHRGPNYVVTDRWTEFKNSEGRFSIETVGPGIYEVQIAAEGFAWAWSESIDTDLGGAVVIELASGGAISGRVVDENGSAVKGARVIPLSKACGTMPRVKDVFVSEAGAVETDGAGRFTLNNLAAGSETLRVTHEDYTFNTVKGIKVVQGEVSGDVEIVLSRGGAVEGYVYDYEGKAQANVILLFQDDYAYGGSGDEEAGRFATATTDANGFYRVEGLPEQMCYVRRSKLVNVLGVARRSFLPQNGVTARLDFGGGAIVFGRMIVDGAPIAETRVTLGDTDTPHWGLHRCYARTDDQGRFSFPGTPAGRYGIYYEQPDKRSEWVKVATVETQAGETDLGVIPGNTGTVRIWVVPSDVDEPLPEGLSAFLQTGRKYYGQRAGVLTEPKTAGEPYIVTSLPPGVYTATAGRSYYIQFREEVELTEEQSSVDVTVTIPRCRASIGGAVLGKMQQSLIMWRSDGKVIAPIIPKNGVYAVEGLPAGDYAIGRSATPSGPPLVEFSLAEGESKTLDLDTSALPVPNAVSRLTVQAVDGSNGIPLTSARIWLRRSGQTFEALATSSKGHVFVVEPGQYVLVAECPGYRRTEKTVEVGEAQSSFIRLTRED